MVDSKRASQDLLYLGKYVSSEDLLKEVEKFFFRAMLRGYVSPDAGKILVSGMPGYKSIIINEGEFRLIDAWCSNIFSQKSAGITTISWRNYPVWVMNYGGYYPELSAIISLLKKALRTAYEANEFLGGRGIIECNEGGFFYKNTLSLNSFSWFKGREEIKSGKNGRIMGFHEYWGMSLIADH